MMSETQIPETAPRSVTAQIERSWYVRADGSVYGPFEDRTVWSFVQEGRVNGASEMSLRPDAGYQPARQWLEIAHWFQPQTIEPVIEIEPEVATVPPSLMVVLAQIRSGRDNIFLQTLESIGDVEPVGDMAFLLRCQVNAEDVKSICGPSLSIMDSLLIVDATDADLAAYNIGESVELQPA